MLKVTNMEHWQHQLDVRVVPHALGQPQPTRLALVDLVRDSEALVEHSVRERGAVLLPVQITLVRLELAQRYDLLGGEDGELDVLPVGREGGASQYGARESWKAEWATSGWEGRRTSTGRTHSRLGVASVTSVFILPNSKSSQPN